MRIGNRERIVIGVIGALGVIGSLHMFVFKGNAEQYLQEKGRYDEITGRLNSIGAARNWDEIYRFEYMTLNHELAFWELFEESRVDVPPEFFAATDEAAQAAHFWAFLDKLEEFRDMPDGTRLTFMDRRVNGWDIQRGLPEAITRAGTDVGDLIRRLQDTDALMKELDKESPLLARTEQAYEEQLRGLGVILNSPPNQPTFPSRAVIKDGLGQLAALMNTLNRVEIIKAALPASELGLNSEAAYNERLLELFRMEDWGIQKLTAYKQLDALVHIIELARKYQLAEISQVRVHDFLLVNHPPMVIEGKEAAPEAAAQPAYDLSAYELDPYAYDDPSMAQPAFQDPSASAEEIIGAAIPMEIIVRGSNLAIMSFLYELTHGSRFIELDELELVSPPQQEGTVVARALLKVMSHYAKPELTVNTSEIANKRVELLRRKVEIASKAGARQLAEAEGFDAEAVGATLPPPPQPDFGWQDPAATGEPLPAPEG
jgi:hypothetical protein